MVYDEGFNIEFDELSFFTFSKYSIENSTKEPKVIINRSYCYETSIGWYHNRDKSKWGCFYAIKSVDNHSKITSEVSNRVLKLATEKQKRKEPMRFKQIKKAKPNSDFSKHNINMINDKPEFSIDEYFKYLVSIPKKFKIEQYSEYKNMSFSDLNRKAGRVSTFNNVQEKNKNYEVNKFRFKSNNVHKNKNRHRQIK